MTSPAAPNVTIPLSDVTAAGLAQRQNQLPALLMAYQQQRAQLNKLNADYAAAKKHYGQKVADAYYKPKIAAATKGTGGAKWTYDQLNTLLPNYKSEYDYLTKLDQGAPTLDTLLGRITPYDPQAAVDTMNAQAQRAYGLQQLTQARQQLNEDYTTQLRDADQQQSDALRGLLSGFSGRGMAYSSGYGNAVGEQNRNYANYTGELASQKQRGLAAADTNEAALQSNYANMISQALVASTGRLAGQAGKLGLGSSDLPYYTELARRKLASNSATPAGG